MTPSDAVPLLEQLEHLAASSIPLAKTANRGGKSLRGDNPYGQKFHTVAVDLKTIATKLRPSLAALGIEPGDLEAFDRSLTILQDPAPKPAARAQAVRDLQLVVRSSIRPRIDAAGTPDTPLTEAVLPLDVIRDSYKDARYYRSLILQANGCYERGWYDGCLVMVRKVFESLIIAVYEAHGKAEELKKDGDFQMLHVLIGKACGETTAWNLGRETKPALRELQGNGNRSAHTRRYNAVKADVDKLRRGIRVAADELLHLANPTA